MNSVIILYLATLLTFSLGYIYNGVNLHTKSLNDAGRKRMRLSLNARANDVIDFDRFRKYSGKLSITTGLLYLSLLAVTIILVPNLTGTLNNREIHLIRTFVIAILVLHLSRSFWLEQIKEKFVKRFSAGKSSWKSLKTNAALSVLTILLFHGIYTQMTYAW
jgi:hypothetical protein